MTNPLRAFSVVGSLLVIAGATAPTPAPPVTTGGDVRAHLETTLREARRKFGFPGAAAAVITSREVFAFACGVRRVDRPDEVTIDDRFGLGSNTKAFTATMLGTLVERGLVRWDVPLSAALPGVTMRPEYREVTLRQVLTHRGGLAPWTASADFARAMALNRPDPTATRFAFAALALSGPPIAPPGSETRYSNADYAVAALAGELAAGRSWTDLLTENVCRPLGIHPSFGPPAAHDARQPWGHSRATGSPMPVDPTGPLGFAMQGAGGLSLSINDYAAFLQMHLRGLRGEDTAVLRSATIRELHRPDGRYALGWGIQEFAGAASSVHAGGNGQFYALVIIQPERDIAVAFLTNDGGDEVEAQAAGVLRQLLMHP